MASEMERVLGQKIGRNENLLQGTGPGEDPEQVRLVSFAVGQKPSKEYERVVWAVSPPLADSGGVVLLDNLILPDGSRFYVLKLHGDVAGWQQQIETGAAQLGVTTARIDGERLTLSDGRVFAIKECVIEPST